MVGLIYTRKFIIGVITRLVDSQKVTGMDNMSANKFHSSSKPLKKDQVYNWFDKHNANDDSQAYIMNQHAQQKAKPNLGQRMFRFAQS